MKTTNTIKVFNDKVKNSIENGSTTLAVKMQSAGGLRLKNDMSNLYLPESCTISFPNGKDDLMNFEFTVRPDEGYYLGGTFLFTFQVPNTYPHEPPMVNCKTKVYHPNIDLKGKVGLNILHKGWKPVLNINSIFYALSLLFIQPCHEDPVNHDAAAVLKDDPVMFEFNVRRAMCDSFKLTMEGSSTRGMPSCSAEKAKKKKLKDIKTYTNLPKTFSKRKESIFKEAFKLSILTGVEVGVRIFSPSGKVHSYGHPSLEKVTERFLTGFHQPLTLSEQAVQDECNNRVKNINEELTEVRKKLENERNKKELVGNQKLVWDEDDVKNANLEDIERKLFELKTIFFAMKDELNSRDLCETEHYASTSFVSCGGGTSSETFSMGPSSFVCSKTFSETSSKNVDRVGSSGDGTIVDNDGFPNADKVGSSIF